MKCIYRRMQEEDVVYVYEIEKSLFQDPWSFKHFLRDIQDTETAYPYILELRDEIIGYSVCWYYAREVHIGNIAVKKKYQRMGYGQIILDKIIKMFPVSQCAYLEVRESNKIALNLYQKNNFNILYKRKSYYANGENALVLVRFMDQAEQE